MRGGSIWRRKAWVWAVPLGFLALNLALFFGNRLVLGVRLIALEAELESRQEQLAVARAERDHKVDLLERARFAREDLDTLYADRLASKRQRLTAVLAHVKDLANRAGLDLPTISYPETVLEEQGLEKLAFVFAVEGDFASLRRFVSLLEASDEFLALEQIAVNESSEAVGARLNIRMTLTTLFALEQSTRQSGPQATLGVPSS